MTATISSDLTTSLLQQAAQGDDLARFALADTLEEQGDYLIAETVRANPVRFHVRWMLRACLPKCLEIEAACLEAEHGLDAWTEDDFVQNLRLRNVSGMCCEARFLTDDDFSLPRPVLGFVVYGLFTGHIDLHRFAVMPCERAEEIQTALLDKLKGKLSSHRRTRIEVEPQTTHARLVLIENEFVNDGDGRFVYTL